MKPSRHFPAHRLFSAAVLLGWLCALAPAPGGAQEGTAEAKKPLEPVTFASNWLPEAEHGGFYQALADGTYAAYGLDVKILPGGPMSPNKLLLAAGRVDFYMGPNMLAAFDATASGAPTLAVAALFQKDPIVLISHPNVGLDRLEDLGKAKAAFVGRDNFTTVWRWASRKWGYPDAIVKPYAFNPAPFLADPHSIQQGYATSEPHEIERVGGFRPNVFLLADHGYESYSTTIETRRETVERRPDYVRRFVEASILGWRNYLHGDNRAANALIRRDNPDMSDETIANAAAKMKQYGIVESGDALTLGIGAMTDERMKRFFDAMVEAGVVPAGLDYRKSYTTQFVNKGIGLSEPRR